MDQGPLGLLKEQAALINRGFCLATILFFLFPDTSGKDTGSKDRTSCWKAVICWTWRYPRRHMVRNAKLWVLTETAFIGSPDGQLHTLNNSDPKPSLRGFFPAHTLLPLWTRKKMQWVSEGHLAQCWHAEGSGDIQGCTFILQYFTLNYSNVIYT